MKTKVITEKSLDNIDWDKVNIVKSELGKIVFTTGKSRWRTFEGICIVGDPYTNTGEFSDNWAKGAFTLVSDPLTIEFNSK